MEILGIDIGGANLKAAHSGGEARLVPFALWKAPNRLEDRLRELAGRFPTYDAAAITMTGELCDCFKSRTEGVHAILDAAAGSFDGKRLLVWLNDATFAEVAQARATPLRAASANWLALAHLAGACMPRGAALLVDVGSTTTDVIPLFNGRPLPRGRTDAERLATHELVYTGVRRTPLCALCTSVCWRGASFAPAAELFATTGDVYLVLGDLPEREDDQETADGRPATRGNAHARIARMVGEDGAALSEAEILGLARQFQDAQLALVVRALRLAADGLREPPRVVMAAGSGEFLVRKAVAALAPPPRVLSLAGRLGQGISDCACAFAVARLARLFLGGDGLLLP